MRHIIYQFAQDSLEKAKLVIINVLDRSKNDVFLRKVLPEEIGERYKLITKDLYEDFRPS